MSALQIVGVGMTTIDILVRLGEMPTWESGGRLRDLCMDGGGPVGTGLAAAARLGARVGYIGTCGNDEVAHLKLEFLTRYGVDVSRVVRRDGPEDQVVLVYVHEQNGERVFAARDHFVRARLAPEELDRDYITAAQALHLDGFHYEAELAAAGWMRAAGKLVLLDAAKPNGAIDEGGRARMGALVRACDVLVCGAGFAQALSGAPERCEAMRALLPLGPRIVVQTEGEEGCYTLTADECFHTPACRVEIVDTTGAGDVFHGAYLVGLLKGWDLRKTARFACAVAALKCTRLGGRMGIPTLDEVMASTWFE
jgi:sulfofructose kinase